MSIAQLKSLALIGFSTLLHLSSVGQFSRNYNRETNPFKNGYQRVAVGGAHTLELRAGKLFAYGDNSKGQLGLGHYVNRDTAVQVGTATNWVLVAAGHDFTLALKNDGTLWSWGSNFDGQLGYGIKTVPITEPYKVGNDNDWVGIAAGLTHAMALKSNGTLWAFGGNVAGQLGVGGGPDRPQVTQVGTDNNWIMVSAGMYHTLALKSNGTLWTWGFNGNGELGLGDNIDRYVPTQVGSDKTWLVAISGGVHNLAVKTDGTLWSWGDNNSGQLGLGDYTSRNTPTRVGTEAKWRTLGSGIRHSLAIKNNGTLFTWGRNDANELGLGDNTSRNLPTQVGTSNNWVSLSPGIGRHSAGFTNDGYLTVWGSNSTGQLGLGDLTNRSTPYAIRRDNQWMKVSAGYENAFLIRSDGVIFGWGLNATAQLGLGDQVIRSSPERIGTANNWVNLAASYSHTIGLKSDGTCWSWGSINSRSTPTIVLGVAANSWKSFAAGSSHVAAILTDGRMLTWGTNARGELGRSTQFLAPGVPGPDYVPRGVGAHINWVKVGAGEQFTIALKNDGTLWGWGRNFRGQLGLGDNVDRFVPVQIGADTSWIDISIGKEHSMALKSNGTLWCWGSNYYGQAGVDRLSLYENFIDQMLPVQTGTDTDWISVEAGKDHSMAMKTDGTLWVWGWNGVDQLGLGSPYFGYAVPRKVGTANDWLNLSGGFVSSYGLKVARENLCTTGMDRYEQLGNGLAGNQSVFVCETLTALPLRWHGFTATRSNASALLQWSTAGEQNTKDFIIQHSNNGTQWTNIGSQIAAGNSSKILDYQFTHTQPMSGRNYYRILQRDWDDKQSYSTVRFLHFEGLPASDLTISALVNGQLSIAASSSFPASVQLYASDGRMVLNQKLNQGYNYIDVRHLAKGVYVLRSGKITRKLMVN